VSNEHWAPTTCGGFMKRPEWRHRRPGWVWQRFIAAHCWLAIKLRSVNPSISPSIVRLSVYSVLSVSAGSKTRTTLQWQSTYWVWFILSDTHSATRWLIVGPGNLGVISHGLQYQQKNGCWMPPFCMFKPLLGRKHAACEGPLAIQNSIG
jgi:hypothetical protein